MPELDLDALFGDLDELGIATAWRIYEKLGYKTPDFIPVTVPD
jgi:hypothetical protein